MKQISKRLTYANVMSSIAVFLILGGASAFAASQLGKNSVGTKQLKANAVSAAKLKKNAVTTPKVKNGAITGNKIAANAIDGSKVQDGSLTGADINSSSLGTVPTAASANSVAGRTVFSFFMPEGVREIVSIGAFTVKARCTLNEGGEDFAELLLYTTEAQSSMDNNKGPEIESFGPEENPITMFTEEAETGAPNLEAGGSFAAVAPGGTSIAGDNEAIGVNVAGHTGQCFFSGIYEKLG